MHPPNPAEALHTSLGLSEEPMGIMYTDTKPVDAFMPKPYTPVATQIAEHGQADMQGTRSVFTCVLQTLWLARKKHGVACFSAEHFGCMGGSFFLGFHQPQVDAVAHFISTGFPGTPMHGERYLDSPERGHQFFQECDAGPAPARYCVCKPLSLFMADETPLLVLFFARPEVLSGLCTLTAFVSPDVQSVRMPFGSGCANVFSWPRRYLTASTPKAVVGGMDPSCRRFTKTDEMTFTVPWALYQTFLARWQESFLESDTWQIVQKKIARSRAVWGD